MVSGPTCAASGAVASVVTATMVASVRVTRLRMGRLSPQMREASVAKRRCRLAAFRSNPAPDVEDDVPLLVPLLHSRDFSSFDTPGIAVHFSRNGCALDHPTICTM